MTIWHQIWSLTFLIGVIGNLTASAALGVPAFLHLHAKIDRHHREHMRLISEQFRVGNYHGNNVPGIAADSRDWSTDSASGKMD